MNSECMSDRDYKGWVDFGRRSTDWQANNCDTDNILEFQTMLYVD